jgi:uncharacterized protein (TIGR03437 family)
VLPLILACSISFSQNLPAFNWNQEVGGTNSDSFAGLAVDAQGNTYVTGTTGSGDFPVTSGVYSTNAGSNFLFKLNAGGSLAWSTYFPAGQSATTAIAVDNTGVYLAGGSQGGLPATPGAYATTFCCTPQPNFFFTPPTPFDAFVTKLNPAGSQLIFSTYLDAGQGSAQSLAIGSDGSAYLNDPLHFYHLNATGSSLLASLTPALRPRVVAVAPSGGAYYADNATTSFQPTAGAFETNPELLPAALGQANPANIAAIVEMDSQLQNIVAATYFGKLGGDSINTLTFDSSGNLYAGGSTLPGTLITRNEFFEAFGPSQGGTGFLAEFSADLSTLLFSSYFGDTQVFSVESAAVASNGTVRIGGATTNPSNVYINSLTLAPPPTLRIDSILNAASQVGGPVTGNETIFINGAGFTAAQLLVNGSPVAPLAQTSTQITAVVPAILAPGPATVQVQTAAASPELVSQDGTGIGPGYILNQDGTLNSATNYAHPGDTVTLFADGVGPLSFTNGFAVTASPVSVFIDGFYSDAVAATVISLPGFPGNVYQLSVVVPNPASEASSNPNLLGFTFPFPTTVTLQIAGAGSQSGLEIFIGPG